MEESVESAIHPCSKLPNGLAEGDSAELRSPTSLRRSPDHALATSAPLKHTLAKRHTPFTTLASQDDVKERPNAIGNSYNSSGLDSTDLVKKGWGLDSHDNAALFPKNADPTVPDPWASIGTAPVKPNTSSALPFQEPLLTSVPSGVHGTGGVHHSSQTQSKNNATSNFYNNAGQNYHQLCQTSSGYVETRPFLSGQQAVGHPPPQGQLPLVHHQHHHYRHQRQQKHYLQNQEYHHRHHHHYLHHKFGQHPMGTQGSSAPAMLYEDFGAYSHHQQQQQLYSQHILPFPLQHHHHYQYHHHHHQQFSGMGPAYLSHSANTDPFNVPAASTFNAKPDLNTNSYADPRSMTTPETYCKPPYYHFANYPRQEMMLVPALKGSINCEDSSSAGGFIGGVNSSNINSGPDFYFPSMVPPTTALPLTSAQPGESRPFYYQAHAMPPTSPPANNSTQPFPRDYNATQPEYNAMQQAEMYPYLSQNHSQVALPGVGGGPYMPFPAQLIQGHEINTSGGNVSDAVVTEDPNKGELSKNYDNTEGSNTCTTLKASKEVEVIISDTNSEDEDGANGLKTTASRGDRCANISVATVGGENTSSCQNSTFQQHLHVHSHKEVYPPHHCHHHHRVAYNASDPKEALSKARRDTPSSVAAASYHRLSVPTHSVAIASSYIPTHPPVDTASQAAELPNNKQQLAFRGKTHLSAEISSSTSTPIGINHYEHHIERGITSHSSQQQHPPASINICADIATEEVERPRDQPSNPVTEPLFGIASNSVSGHPAVVNSDKQDTEEGSKPGTANTTPVRHPPCYTNAMDHYWNSFQFSHILTLDAGAFPVSSSVSSPQGLPVSYEPSMHSPPSSHQSPIMYGVGGVRAFKPSSPHLVFNTSHSHKEEMCIPRQACGDFQKKGPEATSTMGSAGARSQLPPFGTLVSGEGAGSAGIFPSSPTLNNGGTSFNSPSCGHMEAEGSGLVSGYPMPVTNFAGNNKHTYNTNVPQHHQQQQRYPQQYSYSQPQPTQYPFWSSKPPVSGIPSQVGRGGIDNINNSYRNIRGGAQTCAFSKMSDHFAYVGAPTLPMVDTGSHLQPNPSSDVHPDTNTAASAYFPMPGVNCPRHVHTLCHPQKQRGNPSYGYPSGIPPLLYEHHVEQTQETWIEELQADVSFDSSVYGNIACLVDSFSPRVPVTYNLELPFQDDVNMSSPRLDFTPSSDSIPSIGSLMHGDVNKVECQDLSNIPHCHAEAVDVDVTVPSTEPQCTNSPNSPVRNIFKQPMDCNEYHISCLHNTHPTEMESSSSGSCPIPSPTSVSDVGRSGVDAGGVVNPDSVPLLRRYQNFEGVHFVEPIVSLASVWHSFNYPFGCLVPLSQPVILSNMRPPESKVVYTPLLSGFRICFHDASAAYAKLLALKRQESNDKLNSKEGSNTLPSPYVVISPSSPGLLTWSASERPDNRNGVAEQVEELARANEAFRTLLTSTTADVDHQSWVAIMWQPVFCGGHTAKQSCGTFLAFYMLRPPRHIFLSFANKSALTCMNSSWDSPIFRVDREMLSFDIWSFKRRYHVGRCVPTSFSSASGSEARQVSVPRETSSAVNSTENKGIQMTNSMGHARDSPQSVSGVSGLGKETRRPQMADDITDFNCSPNHLDPNAANKQALTPSSTRQVRLPLIGLIFNRSRSDVWLCLSTTPPAEAMPGAGSFLPSCPQRMYRAPLFLLVSALQLMCWNAFEEDRHLKRIRIQRTGVYDKEEHGKQSELCRNRVTNTACGEGVHTPTTHSEKVEADERSGRKKSRMDVSTDAAMNCTQVERPISRDQSFYPVDISHNENAHSDMELITSNSQSEHISLLKVAVRPALSPNHVALSPYYTKGTELLVSAARQYRNLREAAMLESNAEEVTSYNHVFVNSHTGTSARVCEPNKLPSNGDGKTSNHPDLPLRVVAGGTNIELCGSSGSVIVGLLDFYQWAQHDASITDLAERYCMGSEERECTHRRNRRHLESR